MTDLHKQIADLENEIQRLSEGAARSRKIEVIAKATMVGGALSLLAFMAGWVGTDPLWFVCGVAAALGGLVLFGSNRSTLDEINAAIRDHESLRRTLIDALVPRTVQEVRTGMLPQKEDRG
jgi:predicted RNA binding protein with dsRBD fold (UPF0201 family)